MRFSDKRVTVLVGNYGSGKTELAISLAKTLHTTENVPVTLVDLDIVNPYFRSAEHEDALSALGIQVLKPTFARSAVDIPALPAEIQSVFDRRDRHIVIDVGGDDTGAAALGRYQASLNAEGEALRCLLVVNCMRPFTRTKPDILNLMARITARARIGFTGIVNNTNLSDLTEPDMLLEAQALLSEVSAESGLPIQLISGVSPILKALPEALQPLCYPIERVMKPEWMD